MTTAESRGSTPAEFMSKWQGRREAFERLDARVSGAALCAEMVEDLRSIVEHPATELLSIAEAAHRTGYSREHLTRLVAQGRIPNFGRRNAPRVRAADLPRKAGPLPADLSPRHTSATSKG